MRIIYSTIVRLRLSTLVFVGKSSEMIVEILIFIFTAILVYFIYTYKRVHKHFEEKGLKYNPGLPIFGNIIHSTFLRKHVIEDIDKVYREFPNEK